MRRVVLALLALAVLLPSLAQARARWLTDADVYFRHECCCPPKHAQAPAPAEPRLQKSCCKLEKQSATALPLAAESPAPPATAAFATPVALVPVLPPLRDVVIAIVPRAQAPPTSTLLAQARGLLL